MSVIDSDYSALFSSFGSCANYRKSYNKALDRIARNKALKGDKDVNLNSEASILGLSEPALAGSFSNGVQVRSVGGLLYYMQSDGTGIPIDPEIILKSINQNQFVFNTAEEKAIVLSALHYTRNESRKRQKINNSKDFTKIVLIVFGLVAIFATGISILILYNGRNSLPTGFTGIAAGLFAGPTIYIISLITRKSAKKNTPKYLQAILAVPRDDVPVELYQTLNEALIKPSVDSTPHSA